MKTSFSLTHYGLGLGLAFLTACAAAAPTAAPTEEAIPIIEPTAIPPTEITPTLPAFKTVDFAEAKSVAVVADAVGNFYVAYGQGQSLWVARSTDGGQTFNPAVLATSDQMAHVLTVERPAIAVSPDGQHVGVAWLTMAPDYASTEIWYAASEDGGQTFMPGQLVASEGVGETTMVQVVLDEGGQPMLAWLSGRHLRFARSEDGGRSFAAAQSLGAEACECCQPHLLRVEQNLFIAYRSLEASAQGDIRDMAVLRSTDEGASFEAATRVSDAHWYLAACPIAGPALATQAGRLYVAWMDGRFEPPGTFSRGDVWLAVSEDGGKSFSPNIRVSTDETLHHSLPFIGVGPQGRLHIVWEAQGTEARVLYYTTSDDGGTTFAPLQVLAQADALRGKPTMAMLAVSPAGQVAVVWIDRLGAHFAMWAEGE